MAKRLNQNQQVELRQRRFKSSFARTICQRIYGKPIHSATWSNWRKWVGCDGAWISGEEFVKLLAIAQVRTEFPRKELVWDEDVAPHLLSVSIKLLTLIQDIDQGYVMGNDALAFLQSFHVGGLSRVALYRTIPGFSTKRPWQKKILLQAFGIPA